MNELLWVAAKRKFTSPGPWPLSTLSVRGRERAAVGGGQKNVHQPWPLALSQNSTIHHQNLVKSREVQSARFLKCARFMKSFARGVGATGWTVLGFLKMEH